MILILFSDCFNLEGRSSYFLQKHCDGYQ